MSLRERLPIDVARFVALTAAMASATCTHAPEPKAKPIVATAPEPEPVPTASPEPVAEPTAETEPAPRPQSSCDNDVGEVSCEFTHEARFRGPACEGFDGACDLLKKGYGYRKRVAAAAARCWSELGIRACVNTARGACNRKALREACPDPKFEPFCRDVLATCASRRQKPDFTLDDCVKAFSGMEGESLEWAKSATGPSAEGCHLAYTIY